MGWNLQGIYPNTKFLKDISRDYYPALRQLLIDLKPNTVISVTNKVSQVIVREPGSRNLELLVEVLFMIRA